MSIRTRAPDAGRASQIALRLTTTLALATLTLLGACAAGGSSDGTLKVGVSGPLSEGYGKSALNGAQIALDEFNANGGANGRSVSFDTADDKDDGAAAAKIAQRFVDDPAVVGVVGQITSGPMVAAARVYDGHLAAVSPTATAGELTGISPWVFRVAPSDSMNGAAMAKFAMARGRSKALVLYENDAYGRGLARAFADAFRGTVVGMDPIDPDGKSAPVFVEWYKRTNPDVVVVAGVEQSGLAVIRAAHASGFSPMFLGSDGWLGMPTIDAKTSEGAWLLAPYDVRDHAAAVQKFVADYRAKFHDEPDGNAALGYDAALAVLEAVKRGGGSRKGVRDALATMLNDAPQGATGTLRFATTGDPIDKPFRPMRISNGTLVSE